MQRVCVIGAGPSGLCAVRYLSAKPGLFEPVVFEKADTIGGTWVYTDETGTDKHGLPVHSSMYRNLKTNLPKEVMAFPDLTFDSSLPSFITRQDVLHYLQQYAAKFNLHNYIKFQNLVESVTPISNGPKTGWRVVVKSLNENKLDTYQFDAVIVCNGHNTVPKIPHLKGQQTFKGQIIHSHCYREPEDFKDAAVVCVGAGPSGQDIALDLHRHAKTVYLSHWKGTLTSSLPDNVIQVPPVDLLDGATVTFTNGESIQADYIMLCTGYEYVFPFLTKQCQLNVEDQRIFPLYKQIFHTLYPSLCFIGMPYLSLPFAQFSCQVRLAVAFLEGSFELPAKDEMLSDIKQDLQKRVDLGWPHRHAHKLGSLQWEYYNQLSRLGQFSPIPRVLQDIYEASYNQRCKDVQNYKEINYDVIDELNWDKRQ